ncbi:hypothetical protein Q7P37_003197 [Cladosporium fusiforme]
MFGLSLYQSACMYASVTAFSATWVALALPIQHGKAGPFNYHRAIRQGRRIPWRPQRSENSRTLCATTRFSACFVAIFVGEQLGTFDHTNTFSTEAAPSPLYDLDHLHLHSRLACTIHSSLPAFDDLVTALVCASSPRSAHRSLAPQRIGRLLDLVGVDGVPSLPPHQAARGHPYIQTRTYAVLLDSSAERCNDMIFPMKSDPRLCCLDGNDGVKLRATQKRPTIALENGKSGRLARLC